PILRRAYFGDSDSSLAPRDSDAANDFWAFFKKYLAVVARKNIRADDRSAHDRGMFNELGIPEGSYQKLHRPTTQLHIDKTARYMLRELPSRVVNEFEYIIHCYLEFCQKDKLVKLKKLRTSQANLPITARRSEILKALETHNVLLIAGDTGCGKSTQVYDI
uniref:Uncharacterized protein n=1 Tax=Plectus sambesii TaxID=2011161 RepID=A0A914V0V8_9BILA